MAVEPPDPKEVEKAVDELVERAISALGDPQLLERWGKFGEGMIALFAKYIVTVVLKVGHPLILGIAKGVIGGEEMADPAFNDMARSAIRDMFGVEIGTENTGQAGRQRISAGSGQAVGRAVIEGVRNAVGGSGGGEIQPSTAPAEAFLGNMAQLALEGWFEGFMFEAASLGLIEKFGDLDDTIAEVLGLGRVSARVMRAIVEPSVVTPFRWDANKRYRPELLSASAVARQVARGRMTREAAFEELARQGYSDARIEALLAEQRKYLGIDDLFYEVHAGLIPLSEAVTTLREQGYDEQTASKEINLRILKRLDAIRNDVISPSIAAYVDRRIGDAELGAALEIALDSDGERREYHQVARARRALNVHGLSPSEARRLAFRGILSVIDYRRALEEAGYDRNAVLALELELEDELAADRELAKKREQADAARLAKEQARAEEQARRREEIERGRALARRGDEADLEAAAVRGLIPIARVEELYRARYDADAAAIYVELLEARREDYLAEQRRREDAIKRAAGREISIADLEEGVLRNELDFGRYALALGQRGFTPEDVELLVRTLRAKKAAQDAAAAARAAAAAAAQRRAIDLGRFERLVRRGVRSMGQYVALLAELGFDEASIAAMRDLLALQMVDDAQAAAAAAAADERLRNKGIALAELRRIVVLGLAPRAAFEAALLAEGFAPDAQILLLRDLDYAIALAEDARTKRNAPAPGGADTTAMPLDRLRQAARLQLVPIATYRARLVREGWRADEIDVEIDLLLIELADVTAARQARTRPGVPAGRGLTLAELARAVRLGLKTLEDFQARAVELGLTPDAIETQLRVLGAELQATQAAQARRELLGVELSGRGVTLAELEAAVMGGSLSLAGFVEQLERAGLATEDAALLGGLLDLRVASGG